MRLFVQRAALRLARIVSLVLVAAWGTVALMRFAPGYFTEAREMDASHAEGAREAIRTREKLEGSLYTLTRDLTRGWLRGDLGQSKQYEVPVLDLIKPRIKPTVVLLASAIVLGWSTALLLALPLSMRSGDAWGAAIGFATCLLLAVPIGAMATASLMTETGGPLTVLTAVIVVRDFKLVYKLLRQTRRAPHLLHARAQGIAGRRIACLYLLAPLTRELLAIGMASLITALGAIVPVEVIFDVPGLGQLAWSGAMNRDLPVLLGVTLLMALAVGVGSSMAEPGTQGAGR